MARKELLRLMRGFQQFREKFFLGDDPTYTKLANNWQGPKTLIIGCSDSRVDPAILASAGPGELFVVRNVANLVPPFERGGGHHGVSAAIEFAVVNLKVQNVIVLGHRQCGGIRALLFPQETQAGGFVQQWMKMADPAKARALSAVGADDPAALWRCCEMESIQDSLANLRSFPFVADAVRDRGLNLLGIYFDIEKGEMLELDEDSGTFAPITV
jgi:carbonic anhydrase